MSQGRCQACNAQRDLELLIEVACTEHDGAHHHLVCRPTIPEQDHLTANCFRRSTYSVDIHRIHATSA